MVKRRDGPALHGAAGVSQGHGESFFEVGGTWPSKGSGSFEGAEGDSVGEPGSELLGAGCESAGGVGEKESGVVSESTVGVRRRLSLLRCSSSESVSTGVDWALA